MSAGSLHLNRTTRGFRSVRLHGARHPAPVDVSLIAQMAPGTGSRLIGQISGR